MIWDLIVGLVLVFFGLLGWAAGISRTWYAVPISVLAATWIVQHLYIDGATFFSASLLLEPYIAILFSYLILWLIVEQICESLLIKTRPITAKEPILVDKIGGAGLGIAKGAFGFICAAMVAYAQNNVPEPTSVDWEDRWLKGSVRRSHTMSFLHDWAGASHPLLAKIVLSDASPIFQPKDRLGVDAFEDSNKEEIEKGAAVGRKFKEYKKQQEGFFSF